jgi:hypothetical protein|eukprot:COSAG01_NODE_180_length_22910_cov_19.255710_10_plen_467_part_00
MARTTAASLLCCVAALTVQRGGPRGADAAITLVDFVANFNSRAPQLYGCSRVRVGPMQGDYGCVTLGDGGGPAGRPCQWRCLAAAEAAFQKALQDTWDAMQGTGVKHCRVREPQNCAFFVLELAASVEASPAVRTSIEGALGLPLGTSIASRYYLMFGDKQEANAAQNLPEVSDAFALPAALKLSQSLAEEIAAGNHTRVLIALTPGFSKSGNYRVNNVDYTGGQGAADNLAQFWADALSANGYPEAKFAAFGEEEIVLDLTSSSQSMQAGVDIVAAQPEASWLEPQGRFSFSNDNGRATLQSGSLTPGGTTPLYDMGITGEGQIIGVADSGIDRSHCMFTNRDGQPVTPTPAFTNVGNPNNDWTTGMDTSNRKIISYYAHADALPDASNSDHGTHVAGSVAGHAAGGADGPQTASGQAYDAQLSFFDIGAPDGRLLVSEKAPQPAPSHHPRAAAAAGGRGGGGRC